MKTAEYLEAVTNDNPDFSRRDAVAGAIEDAREAGDDAAVAELLEMANAIESDPSLGR